MKKVMFTVVMILMVLVTVFANAKTVDHECIEEYMYNISGDLDCKSLGVVDVSTMTQEDFSEWCFGLFPDMTRGEATDHVYVGLREEDVHGYDIWGLYIYDYEIHDYKLMYIVTFVHDAVAISPSN